MRSLPSLAFLILSSVVAHAGPGTANPYGGRRAIVFGIDGCRSDALKQEVEAGNAPNIAALIADGTVTWSALAGGWSPSDPTNQDTMSGPGWSSVCTGVWRNKHGVSGNSFSGRNFGNYPHFFKRVKDVQPTANLSSLVSWPEINNFIVADSGGAAVCDCHTHSSPSSYDTRDVNLTAETLTLLQTGDPDIIFHYQGQVDIVGHGNGFSPTVAPYLVAIRNADQRIGQVMAAVKARPQYAAENWIFVLTTDHGGTAGGSHGGQSFEERTIPFIVSGKSVPKGVYSGPVVGQVAVPATVMRHLGQSISGSWGLEQDGITNGPTFAATRHPSSVDLSWSMPPAGIPGLTGFELRRNGTAIGTFSLAQTSATDPAPGGGTVQYELVLVGTDESTLKKSLLIPGAGTLVWDDANANNNWNTTDANWADGGVFATGDQVHFTGTLAETVIVDAAGVAPFATTISGSGSYTFNGGSILDGTLAKTGAGSLALGSANSFTSVTTSAGPNNQSSGSIHVGNAGALGSGTVTFGNTGSMTALYFLPAMGSATVANNLVLSSPTAAVTTRFLTDETNVAVTLSGLISGGNANQEFLVDNDSGSNDVGKIRLTNAANTFTVSRFRMNRGGLVVTSDGALGNTANGLTLDVSSSLANSGLVLEGAVTLNASRALTVQSQTVIDTQATDDIVNGPITYAGQLVKRGSAALRLNAAATGTAGMSLTEGSLTLGNAVALGTGSLNVETTAAAGFLNATPLPAVATIANPIVLPADTAATNRTVLMTGGSGRQLALSGVISGGSANTTLYLNTSTSGDISATFLLTGANTFTGKVQLNRGSLSINSNASFGAAGNAVVIDANSGSKLSFTAPMTFTHPTTLSTVTVFDTAANAVDVTAAIGGDKLLTKTGTGTLTLSAVNPLTGAVDVSAGQVIVNGSLATSVNAVTVSTGATLGGTGTISRPVTLNGILAPGGSSAGALTIADVVTVGGGSTVAVDLSNWNGAAGVGYDTVATGGVNVTATAASKVAIQVNATGLTNFSETAKSFVLASSATTPTGFAADNWAITVSGFTGTGSWALQPSGNNLTLVYTPLATGFSTWIAGKLTSGQDATLGGDPDRDGLTNGIEYVLGTEPGSASLTGAPAMQTNADSLVFTFTRTHASASLNPAVEVSETMAEDSWVTVSAGIVVTPKDATSDTVTVTIPKGLRTTLFARLKVAE